MSADFQTQLPDEGTNWPEAPTAIVTNIQRFSIHDGPGIRTTVFFKGCPLCCLWCHNPETISFEMGEGSVRYTARELAKEAMRDQIFFGEDGGVTISGGEPLAQDMAFMTEFLRELKKQGINIACDTCGEVPWVNFELVMPYVDVFLYDLKLATESAHIKFTGRSNKRIIENLKKLAKTGKAQLRIPVIGGANEGNEMKEILKIAAEAAPNVPIKLIPYHNLGIGKWEKLGKTPQRFFAPTEEYVEGLRYV